jgi:proline iminopeptidase
MPYPYPAIEPHDSGMLEAGDGHHLYWEACGDPHGKPAVALHGGPGGACSPGMRRMFDPRRYRAVLFDQRNCGRSRPHAADLATELAANTTEHLIADIERLREHLGVEQWLVWGGSWGVTLALAYAERFPRRVSELVLVAITSTSRREIDWLYGGLGRFFPAQWAAFRAHVGAPETATGTELARAYDALLQGPDQAAREAAAAAWCAWEDAVVALDEGVRAPQADVSRDLAFARLCAHYFSRHGFLDDGELLRHVDRLRDIPAVLVHGRLDLTAPLETAWRLAQAWPAAELHVVDTAGHASPALGEVFGAALDRFAGYRPDGTIAR